MLIPPPYGPTANGANAVTDLANTATTGAREPVSRPPARLRLTLPPAAPGCAPSRPCTPTVPAPPPALAAMLAPSAPRS